MKLCDINLKEINSQISLQSDPSVDPSQNEIIENNQEVFEYQEEQPTQEEPIIVFHPTVINSLNGSWKQSEFEYARNMNNLFRSVRKQNENISAWL